MMFAKPSTEIMSDLPFEQMHPGLSPFLYVSMDAYGPYQTKFYHSLKKRYGCLFTCMPMRAIHIEMLYSLDAESFLCAFKWSIACRGLPIKIFSDNGHNFLKGEPELCKAFFFHTNNSL